MLKKLSNTFFTRLAIAGINLIIAIIISNKLGAGGRGEQGLILASITIISLVTSVIGAGAITYFTPRLRIKYLLFSSYIWNAVICAIVFLVSGVQPFLEKEVLVHIALLTFILTGTQINTGILLGKEKIEWANSIQLISSICIVLFISVGFFFYNAESIRFYISALYIGYSFSFIVSVILLVFSRGRSNTALFQGDLSFWQSLKQFTVYGMLNQIDVIAQMLSFRFSYYFINAVLSLEEVGVYANAVSIIESIWLISRSISLVQNSRIVNSTDVSYSKQLTLIFLKVSSIAVLVACIGLYAIPSGFYSFLFGDGFSNVRLVLIYFLPGVLVFNASFIFSGFFAGIGMYKYNVLASIVGLIVTVAGAYFFIPLYGLVGAGISASLSYAVTAIVKLVLFKIKYQVTTLEFLIKKNDIQKMIGLFRKDKF